MGRLPPDSVPTRLSVGVVMHRRSFRTTRHFSTALRPNFVVLLPHECCAFFLILGATLTNLREREEREESGWAGVFSAFLPARWSVGCWWLCPLLCLVVGLGFGFAVRAWGEPRLGGYQMLFFPCLALRRVRPWLRCSPHVAYVGFLFLCLARLLVAPGRPLAFPQRLRFLPFVIFYYSMYPRYLQYTIRFVFRFFCKYPYYKEQPYLVFFLSLSFCFLILTSFSESTSLTISCQPLYSFNSASIEGGTRTCSFAVQGSSLSVLN